jgi:MFS transporter, FSR family, fosmidomycin resistance protein
MPVIGLLAQAGHRRLLMTVGGLTSAVALAGNALATGFPMLLGAFILGDIAWTAFVGLAQTVVMDAEPGEHERNMARWVFVGSIGVTLGPLVLAGATLLGFSWRAVFWLLAAASVALVVAAYRLPIESNVTPEDEGVSVKTAARALRVPEVGRWLTIIHTADLLVDVFFTFLALYLVDVAGATPAQAGFGVALWSIGTVVGSALVLPLLKKVDGARYLRISASAALVTFLVLLLSPSLPVKLGGAFLLGVLGSGWYSIPKGRLFSALPGQSGTAVALYGATSLVGDQSPLMVGALAATFGLGNAMWFLALGPVTILLLVRRPSRPAVERARS